MAGRPASRSAAVAHPRVPAARRAPRGPPRHALGAPDRPSPSGVQQRLPPPAVLTSRAADAAYPCARCGLAFAALDRRARLRRPRARCAAAGESREGVRQGKDPSGGVLGLIKAFFLGIVRSLQDFGVSRRSIWEGGVGLFLLASVGAAIAFTSWVLGKRPGRYLNSYQFTISFPVAYGLSIGTPVRIRGVNVGSVVGIKPGMDAVDTMVEVKDEAFVVPRDALVEINQLGLIAETMIDITPKSKGSGDEGPETALAADGVASAEASVDSGGALAGAYTASPLDKEGCAKEGVLVCHRGRIQGQQGVSMDEFIAVW